MNGTTLPRMSSEGTPGYPAPDTACIVETITVWRSNARSGASDIARTTVEQLGLVTMAPLQPSGALLLGQDRQVVGVDLRNEQRHQRIHPEVAGVADDEVARRRKGLFDFAGDGGIERRKDDFAGRGPACTLPPCGRWRDRELGRRVATARRRRTLCLRSARSRRARRDGTRDGAPAARRTVDRPLRSRRARPHRDCALLHFSGPCPSIAWLPPSGGRFSGCRSLPRSAAAGVAVTGDSPRASRGVIALQHKVL